MINPKELRIGNLVRGPRGIEIIAEIGEETVRCKVPDKCGLSLRGCEEIDPIPITPEILEKIEGYDRQMEGLRMFNFYGYATTLCWGEYCANSSEVPVKYLHELQNLFYFLYKEELKISL